jgi:hypothetical protein
MPYTAQERREIMARAYAILEETAPYTQRGAVVSRATGPKLVYKTTVQPEPREASKAPTKLPATTRGNSQQPWWEWVDARMEHRLAAYSREIEQAVGQVIGEVRAQMRERCDREVGFVKRDLELTRRELAVLRHEVGVERGLRDLRRQVVAAQKAVPNVPAIEARLDEENKRLKAKPARLEHELEVTQDKLGKVRVNQSITDYNLSQMRKEAAASKASTVEMELQTSTSRLVMRDIHPTAVKALREFAAQAVADGATVWFRDPPAGNA